MENLVPPSDIRISFASYSISTFNLLILYGAYQEINAIESDAQYITDAPQARYKVEYFLYGAAKI